MRQTPSLSPRHGKQETVSPAGLLLRQHPESVTGFQEATEVVDEAETTRNTDPGSVTEQLVPRILAPFPKW